MLTLLSYRYRLPIVLIMMSLFFACTPEEQVNDSCERPLVIANAVISGVEASLRATLSMGDIGVFRLTSSGYSEIKNNIKYTYSGSGWSAASGVTPINLSKNTANLCAYYPFSNEADYSDGQVTLTSQLYENTKDLCYQTGVTASSEAAASFTLEHAYSMITFTINRSATYPGTCAITNLSLANAGILTANSINMTTGDYGIGTAGTVSLSPSINSIAIETNVVKSVLMVPVTTSMTENTVLSLTVDGKVMTTTISTTALPILEAGRNYSISVTINGSALFINNVSITDWSDISVINQANYTSGNRETANCYIVSPGNSITIPTNIKGNGNTTLASLVGYTTSIVADSMGIVWQTTADLISPITFDATNQIATITANSTPATGGNAVIAAYSEAGTILWSWHIWVTNYNPNTPSNGTTHTLANSVTTNIIMDRNLGAVETTYSSDNFILHYQWGRKDPLPIGSVKNALNNDLWLDTTTYLSPQTVDVSILRPFAFIGSSWDWLSSPNDALWGGASIGSTKTIFDPCPAGWRVPVQYKPTTEASPWEYLAYNGGFTFSTLGYGGTYSNIGTYSRGWNFTYNGFSVGFYPSAGYRRHINGEINGLNNIQSSGRYWTALPHRVFEILVDYYGLNPSVDFPPAGACSVRCVQEF